MISSSNSSEKCCKNYNISANSPKSTISKKPELIFFGNGPLADYTYNILKENFNIIFHAKTKEDLATVKTLKTEHRGVFGVLASFGVMIREDVLDLFEPTGILNIHPSLLPKYRGASPIESAILAGDTSFSVSVMKLVRKMDAGPLYYQETLENLPLEKSAIYNALATTASTWISENIKNLPIPVAQNDSEATFCEKFDKSRSILNPWEKPASVLLREIIAFAGFPTSKLALFGHETTILAAHTSDLAPTALLSEPAILEPLNAEESALLEPLDAKSADFSKNPPIPSQFLPKTSPKSPNSEPKIYRNKRELAISCADGRFLYLDHVKPAGKKDMDIRSFLNGYAR